MWKWEGASIICIVSGLWCDEVSDSSNGIFILLGFIHGIYLCNTLI